MPDPLESLSDGELRCPFCNERDFDDVGLKLHLIRGECAPFQKLDVSLPTTRRATQQDCGVRE